MAGLAQVLQLDIAANGALQRTLEAPLNAQAGLQKAPLNPQAGCTTIFSENP
jgi:hypothetical protein